MNEKTKPSRTQNFVGEVVKVAGPMKLPILLRKGEMSDFKLYFFSLPKGDYYVVEKGSHLGEGWPLVRVHSACNIAHIFHSQRCDCQAQLELAEELIEQEGRGMIIYALNHEGRGVGPFDHVRVYQKQDEGFDTVDSYLQLGLPVDKREYDEVRIILDWFGIKRMRLLTNNPRKISGVEKLGFQVRREPLVAKLHPLNQSQIVAKVEKLGHLILLPAAWKKRLHR